MRSLAFWIVIALTAVSSAAGAAGEIARGREMSSLARPEKRQCFSAAETRNQIAANGLADPFAIIRQKKWELRADVIGVRLCEIDGARVYEMDFLRNDGRLIHAVFDATTGKTAKIRR